MKKYLATLLIICIIIAFVILNFWMYLKISTILKLSLIVKGLIAIVLIIIIITLIYIMIQRFKEIKEDSENDLSQY